MTERWHGFLWVQGKILYFKYIDFKKMEWYWIKIKGKNTEYCSDQSIKITNNFTSNVLTSSEKTMLDNKTLITTHIDWTVYCNLTEKDMEKIRLINSL